MCLIRTVFQIWPHSYNLQASEATVCVPLTIVIAILLALQLTAVSFYIRALITIKYRYVTEPDTDVLTTWGEPLQNMVTCTYGYS